MACTSTLNTSAGRRVESVTRASGVVARLQVLHVLEAQLLARGQPGTDREWLQQHTGVVAAVLALQHGAGEPWAGRHQTSMSGSRPVPETSAVERDELSADDAWRTLRRYGGWRLLCDAFCGFVMGRFQSRKGARTAVESGGAAFPDRTVRPGRPGGCHGVITEAVLAVTPGASKSLVDDLLTNERAEPIGEAALVLGLITAVVALTRRVGGVARDRPALRKWARALILVVPGNCRNPAGMYGASWTWPLLGTGPSP